MAEIDYFKVNRADAVLKDGKLTVRLFYPKNPEKLTTRLKGDLSFGVKTLGDLLKRKMAQIATNKHPICPSSAGSLYLLKDGYFVCHRRDKFAPLHPLFHSACAGYPDSSDLIYTERGLLQTGLRETAEECLLITKERKPRLIVPTDSKIYTLESAKRLGLNLEPLYVDAETIEPSDNLEVYYEDNKPIFTAKAFLSFIWNEFTSLTAMQIRRIPFSVNDVFPIDAEGDIKGGKFVHFNRESYMIHPSEIEGKAFGEILKNPKVFRTKINNGIPEIVAPEYAKPYLGPNNTRVKNPHIWAPDDLLVCCLDALCLGGYKNKKLEIELEQEKSRLEGSNLLPKEVLAKDEEK